MLDVTGATCSLSQPARPASRSSIWHIPWGQSDDAIALDDASRWVAIPFVALWTLPLLLRRRSGLVAGLAIFIAVGALAVIDRDATDSIVLFVMLLAASATIGLHEDRRGGDRRRRRRRCRAHRPDSRHERLTRRVGRLRRRPLRLGPARGGQVVRSITERNALLEARTEELERLHAEQAAAAVTEERTRIANELHDVIAQGVSVMTVQASGARLLLRSDPERAREAIVAVEDAGREALTETRRLLGVFRRDSSELELSPLPGVASIRALVDRENMRGLPTTLAVEGEPKMVPASVQMTAYRVVDEALAYVRGHLGVSEVTVTLRWETDALVVEIADDGRCRDGAEPARALAASLAERLRLHGGSVDTTLQADGSRPVNARIPLEART